MYWNPLAGEPAAVLHVELPDPWRSHIRSIPAFVLLWMRVGWDYLSDHFAHTVKSMLLKMKARGELGLCLGLREFPSKMLSQGKARQAEALVYF